MKRQRVLASLLAIGLVAFSIGTATAWFSDSETLRFEITAADRFEDAADKVWVCKIVGPPHDLRVKPGKNPIHVSVNSVDAQGAFSDAHPSYVVDSGEVVCVVPDPDDQSPAPDESRTARPPEEEEPTTTTTATSTSTSEPTTTTTTTSEITTTTIPETSTTTIPHEPSTTTSTSTDNDV